VYSDIEYIQLTKEKNMNALVLSLIILASITSFAKDIETTMEVVYSKYTEGDRPTGEIKKYSITEIYPEGEVGVPNPANQVQFSFYPDRHDRHPVYNIQVIYSDCYI
jgi:hypothetical protein